MSYEHERASRIGHIPTALSPAIMNAIRRWETPSVTVEEPEQIKTRLIALDDLPRDRRPDPRFAIAFDGSNQEVEARAGYPSVRVGFVQIAGVYVDILKFLNANRTGLVNARELERAQITQTVNAVLPGANVNLKGLSGRDTWRAEFDRMLHESGVDDFGPKFSLADALMIIHGLPGSAAPEAMLSRCPACGRGDVPQAVGSSGGRCMHAGCHSALHLADVLRLHEEFTDEGENVSCLNRAMNIAERLLLVLYIDGFYRLDPHRLSQGLFITDGPLAVYGPMAPMKSKFLSYWQQLCSILESRDIAVPLLVGIEKTGRFVDHAYAVQDHIPPGHVLVMDTVYINRYVINKDDDHYYGQDEFYGRRFMYRTTTGEILVVTVPRVPGGRPYEKPVKLADGSFAIAESERIESYPTLRATLEVLDLLQTRLYPNAVIPIALAHSASSLPLGTGRSVLTLLAQQGLGMPQDSISLSRFKPQRYGHR